MGTFLKNRKGQTSVEYLMLLTVAFLSAYLVITGPVADFTSKMVNEIKSFTANITRSGESAPNRTDPYSPERIKAVHL